MYRSRLVYTVVLNWNNADDTLQCLESLSKSHYANHRILVVDNGSVDGSAGRIRSEFPSVELVELNSNRGYAEGNNAGIELAIKRDADYVLILNNDTIIAPNLVEELVRFAEAEPTAGIIGPKVYCLSESEKLYALGSSIAWQRGETIHRAMFESMTSYSHVTDPEEVDFIAGCGVLLRRELIQNGGLLDQSYYLNFEDVEFSVRARKLGFQTWLVPSAVIWHKVSATLGRESAANTYYTTRNSLKFFMNNGPRKTRWLAVTRILTRTIRTAVAWTIKRRYRRDNFGGRRAANLYALRDFLIGRHGKMGDDVARGIGEL